MNPNPVILAQTPEEKLAMQRIWDGLMARCPPPVLPPQMVKRIQRCQQLVTEGVLTPPERQPGPPVVLAPFPVQDVAMRPPTEIAAPPAPLPPPPATIVPLPPPMEMPPELRPTKKRSRWSSEDEADEMK